MSSSATTASPEVMALVSIGVIAALYAFICGIRQDCRARRVRAWVLEHHPDSWRNLPRGYRFFGSKVALRVLLQTGRLSDPEFTVRYAHVRRLERPQLISYTITAACITLVLIGTRFWGWFW